MSNYFSNNKWVVWIIGLLVALNLLTLSMLWFSKQGPPRNGPHKRGQMDMFFAKKLNLTEDQQEQLKSFRKAHRQQVKETRGKMDELRKQRMDVLTKRPQDTAQLNDLARQIGLHQTQMENILSEHYFQLHAMCNEEQKEKLGSVFHELAKRMGPRGKRSKKKDRSEK